MRSNRTVLLLIGCAACCLVACGKKSSSAGSSPGSQKVLARVGDGVVTADDLEQAARNVSPVDRDMMALSPDQKKKKLFDNLVNDQAGIQEARRRGLDRDPQIMRAIDRQLLSRLLTDEVYSKVKPEDVPEDQVQAYYNEHINDFKNEEEVRISAIFMRDEVTAKKVATLAKAARKTDFSEDRRGFRDLMRNYRDPGVVSGPTRDHSGDLPFFDRQTTRFAPEMVTAAFTLKEVGETAGPIKTETGFYVIKLAERKAAATRTLDDARQLIRQRLVRQVREHRVDEFLAGLAKQTKVDVDTKAFNEVALPSRR
jgi:peptidyl-prolyl cis-trans isomerase C